jgi:hypothetical protein
MRINASTTYFALANPSVRSKDVFCINEKRNYKLDRLLNKNGQRKRQRKRKFAVKTILKSDMLSTQPSCAP